MGSPTVSPMLPGSLVPRAKRTVRGAQTPFSTPLAVRMEVQPVREVVDEGDGDGCGGGESC